MSADSSLNSAPGKKKKKNQKSQLRVVFDTNALYITPQSLGSASDLLRQEIADLIADSKYPDLDILWYLPEVVRHERQYQMQTEALKLRPAINRIERLLGHNLALTDQILLDHVKTKIDEKKGQLGLQELALDHRQVDWPALIRASEYRTPPFQPGDKEKGFRDSLVAESFLQLLESSPKTPALCRVVLVTSDQLLSQAIKGRIAGSANASVLPSIEELKGLINTIVSNVGEDFIAQLKPKASKLFFVSGDEKDVLYYKENVGERIRERFSAELAKRPGGTTFRRNGTWLISQPNFSRKEGRRVYWTSRIEIEVEAGTATNEAQTATIIPATGLNLTTPYKWEFQPSSNASYGEVTGAYLTPHTLNWPQFPAVPAANSVVAQWSQFPAVTPENRVVTQKGKDIFEVLWSAEVTMTKELKKAAIEELRHIELTCQPIS